MLAVGNKHARDDSADAVDGKEPATKKQKLDHCVLTDTQQQNSKPGCDKGKDEKAGLGADNTQDAQQEEENDDNANDEDDEDDNDDNDDKNDANSDYDSGYVVIERSPNESDYGLAPDSVIDAVRGNGSSDCTIHGIFAKEKDAIKFHKMVVKRLAQEEQIVEIISAPMFKQCPRPKDGKVPFWNATFSSQYVKEASDGDDEDSRGGGSDRE